jgi:hemolysin III
MLLDHSAVFLCIACSYSSISILLLEDLPYLPYIYTTITIIVLWILCLAGIYHVHYYRTQRMKIWVSIVILTLPSYPSLSSLLTLSERALVIFALLLYGVGAYIYAYRLLDAIPKVFGYHEIFHIFTVCASFTAFELLRGLSQDHEVRCEEREYTWAFQLFQDILANTLSTYEDICTGR